MTLSRSWLFAILGLLVALNQAQAENACVIDQYALPADIPQPNSSATASDFQEFSWLSFLGLNAPAVGELADPQGLIAPQWSHWSSSVDMLICQGSPTPEGCDCIDGNCANSGSRYYPAACREVENYDDYRVLDQVGKTDDSFLEAATGGLSNDAVIDRFGNFLRYEILVSPATYDEIVGKKLYDESILKARTEDVNMSCGTPDYVGGDPANPQMGAMVLKAAWMDVHGAAASAELNLAEYYTEDLLVFTPAYRNKSGVETCEVRKMAMVGMHIEHKTLRQPNWIWSTFEHVANAPNCTESMPGSGQKQPNTSCPDAVDKPYNFFGTECNDGSSSCQACNSVPESNDPGGACINPITPDLTGWCLDQPAAITKGKSKLCRQVAVIEDPLAALDDPLPENYPQAAVWNHNCATALTANGPNVWANYMLVSGQWLKGSALPEQPDPPDLPSCINVKDAVFSGTVNRTAILPQVSPASGSDRPFLGNTAMESYDKPNCLGCHAKAVITNNDGQEINTDFMYWLALEVAALENNALAYSLEYTGQQCQPGTDTLETRFLLEGAVLGAEVVNQSFDLVVALTLPNTLPAPSLQAYDAEDASSPWILAGKEVAFEVDPTCTAGQCEVDSNYALPADQRWVQYRTTEPVSLTQGERQFAGSLGYRIPTDDCNLLDHEPFRAWASDSSSLELGNFVDAAIVSGKYESETPDPPAPRTYDVPTLGLLGLLSLGGLLLMMGWQTARRQRYR